MEREEVGCCSRWRNSISKGVRTEISLILVGNGRASDMVNFRSRRDLRIQAIKSPLSNGETGLGTRVAIFYSSPVACARGAPSLILGRYSEPFSLL